MITKAFNKAGAKPAGESGIDLLDAILHERPDLQRQNAYFPAQGQKGHTIIIGNEVFKGPRQISGECRDDFETECKVLKDLENSGLPVPKLTTVGKEHFFLGMTRVPGVQMGHDLTMDQQRALAKELIDFVVGMAKALPLQNGKFATHDDLWYANIMVDPETKHLTGVIDFGKVKYITANEWKPMYDFSGTPFQKLLQDEFDRRKHELPGAAAELKTGFSRFWSRAGK
ncbi:MAG: phosphotransferase [Alphaproteobacteria bacterium]|nr:phosphotransferase [Alphaproteobacteria bacterium]